MIKNIVLSALLGSLVLIISSFIFNGILGFNSSINMKPISNEREVYEALTKNIIEPGRYICNPEITKELRFEENVPVYSILYGGVGHEAAGKLMIIGLVIYILVLLIATWMLSLTKESVLNSYWRKVLFFCAIGMLFALFTHMQNYGIGNYPIKESVLLAIYSIFIWTLIGLVVAWKIKPVA